MKTEAKENRRKPSRGSLLLIVAAAIAVFAVAMVLLRNTPVVTTHYDVQSDKIESPVTIAQISDYHGCERYADQVLQILKKEKPQVIVITGDYVDEHHADVGPAVELAKEFVEIAPTYYVTGNHEIWVDTAGLIQKLSDAGVTVLRQNNPDSAGGTGGTDIGGSIRLHGIDDPYFYYDSGADSTGNIARALDGFPIDSKNFNVLLSHRAEAFDAYRDAGFDLALTGHAHGGQFRLPFFGGLAAPDQGLFPRYDSGVYREAGTTMIVSRGIGDSFIPVRINNPPEVVVVHLK